MAQFVAFFFVALAFQGILAAPAADAGEKTLLEQLAAQIEDVTKDITTTLNKNVPDTKTINEAFATHSTEFTQNVESILKKFQTEIDSNKGKGEDLLKEISGKLGEAIENINKASGPDATKKVTELRTELESNVKTLAAEFEKLGKNVQPGLEKAGDQVGTFAKDVLDDFLKAAKTFQTQVKDAVEKQ